MQGANSEGESKKADAQLDVNEKPKRPPTAFYLYLEEDRKRFSDGEVNSDNKSIVSNVSKAAFHRWMSILSEAEKAPYVYLAKQRQEEYEMAMMAYNKKQAEGPVAGEEEESVKSKSEVHDEDGNDEDVLRISSSKRRRT